ncbi:MerR family transcriptional regulator [Flagellimonas halotolerans]|uniref:MerR family transcriptional regulator n=1 Tax=Flagellimonas halotolerans TaxID=3112164 RepID=A0ABU6IRQ8_9FLAO|nr:MULTISPECIES: MerR family transcriptional regulator [unclassified Allomuricauda]MEC3966075.1 MerR family transcriptional regulator [Muricauda sp. SYSU M86414]MEC4265815.1 MerR family transcriptional regulator [Muricauda sp. SYSU M84420]
MNSVKTSFSIRDMENLSGIKAHTIRIWEKRYDLFRPERTNTNIRTYNITSLQKLLNVTLLYNNGYKISKIAKLGDEKIPALVNEIVSRKSEKNHILNSLKLSMLNFDQSLFLKTYNGLMEEKSFTQIFNEVFIPLLNELGLLWQTNTISPAHEHFISNLIKQKIYIHTEKLQFETPAKKNEVYVLFLPENEIHELGLLYINYQLALHGYKTIYLGQTMPVESLEDLLKYYDNIRFISYFTVAPTKDDIDDYFKRFRKVLKKSPGSKLYVLGHQIQEFEDEQPSGPIKIFKSINQLIESL